MNPFALTAEERAGAMMAPARTPDVGAFMDNLGALRAMLGPSVAQRMVENTEDQKAWLAAGNRGPRPLTEDRVWLADDVAGALLGPIGMAGVIKAYHGSPHRFSKFSMDKIGTGEGAQAYGHGLYMAESPDVARQYRDNLAYRDSLSNAAWNAPPVPSEDSASAKAAEAVLRKFWGSWEPEDMVREVRKNAAELKQAQDWLQQQQESLAQITPEISDKWPDMVKRREDELASAQRGLDDAQAAADALPALEKYGVEAFQRQSGALYTTRLDVEPEDLLDYDAPLAAQPAPVRRALGLEKAADLEGMPNGVARDANALRNLTEGTAFRSKGFGGLDIPTQTKVLAHMFGAAQDPQVLDAVVKLIPVDVMNVLRAKKLTPEMLFHNKAVLSDLLAEPAAHKGVPISVDVPTALAKAVTQAAAEKASVIPRGAGLAKEGAPAVGADNSLLHMDIIEPLGQNATGADLYKALESKLGRTAASSALREAGIPGIRYLDQGSRGAGEGTRNFVIFDDSLVDITHVDGKPVTPAERAEVLAQHQDALPMDQASRMARAREMGFDVDTPMFHGSSNDFDAFDITIDRTGAGYDAAWLTDDASLAYRYSRSSGGSAQDAKVMEVRAALENPKIIDIEELIKNEAEKIGADLDMFESMSEAQNMMLGPDWKKQAVIDAKNEGHDGLILKNYIDMPGGDYAESPSTVYAVFDPTKIRKLEAKFDPAKRNSADLLAGVAGGAVAVGAAAKADDRRKKKKPDA